jgi:hypothetical protein
MAPRPYPFQITSLLTLESGTFGAKVGQELTETTI